VLPEGPTMNAMSSMPLAYEAALTPGSYIRTCRKRAGVTARACAEAIALQPSNRLVAIQDLRRLERDEPGDYGRLVRSLRDRAVFPFDFGIFSALAAETCDPSLDDVGGEV
jgi:hypothetical protein